VQLTVIVTFAVIVPLVLPAVQVCPVGCVTTLTL